MKYILTLLILIVIIIGGAYFLFAKSSQNVKQENSNQLSCATGVNGNTGDNFCSNYHTPSSKCQPRLEDTYPDGCTKTSPSGKTCVQVITSAKDPKTGQCKDFPTPCDVPNGWEKTTECR